MPTPDMIARDQPQAGRAVLIDPRARWRRRFFWLCLLPSLLVMTTTLVMALVGFTFDITLPMTGASFWTLIVGRWVAEAM